MYQTVWRRSGTGARLKIPEADPVPWLPDLTRVDGIAAVVDGGTREVDAVYYDTDDLRLAGASAALNLAQMQIILV